MNEQTDPIKTDFEAGTLSAADREHFLKCRGLTADLSQEEADKIRQEWPDEDILMLMGQGIY